MAALRIAGKLAKANGNALQRDLFTGAWQDKPPRRGNGSHIRLKPVEGEKPVVSGMASYAGEGPAGKYCKDCRFFGKVAVQRTHDVIETNPAGCLIYSRRTGHAASPDRRSIKLSAACKFFETAHEAPRNFIIDQAGAVHRVESIPKDLRDWPDSSGALLDVVVCASRTNQTLACTSAVPKEKP